MSSPNLAASPDCPLCVGGGETVLFDDGRARIILVDGPDGVSFPGFCRVIWNAHVREMTDLSVPEQQHLFGLVLATERTVRSGLAPDKVNLASFGNMVPHLHWHVIPRWENDSHFPDPIWAAPRRPPPARPVLPAGELRQLLLNALQPG